MRTLLILSKLRAFPASVEAGADFSKYQLIVKEDLRAAESLLTRGAIDAVILDLELTDVNAIRLIEQVREAAPEAPLIVVTLGKAVGVGGGRIPAGRVPRDHQADSRQSF